MGTVFYKFLLEVQFGLVKKSPMPTLVGESNQNVFLIHKDAPNFAEFEISELEILRFDCIYS